VFVLGLFLAAASVAPPAPPKNAAAAAMQISLQKQRESLQKQRESFRQQPGMKQNAATAAEFIAPIPALVKADCAPLSRGEAEDLITGAAQKHSLESALIRAVMRQESGFRPCAISIKGAQGLMQLMPATAGQFHVVDPYDPKQNVEAGAALLKQLLEKYKGDLRLALVAYNAGANRADSPSGEPYPEETQKYIASIFAELGIDQHEPPPPLAPLEDKAQDPPSAPSQGNETHG
jgi:soluble lytic murein transglycosylase-like protein